MNPGYKHGEFSLVGYVLGLGSRLCRSGYIAVGLLQKATICLLASRFKASCELAYLGEQYIIQERT